MASALTTRLIVALAALATCAVAAATAAADPLVRTHPSLFPGFRSDTLDYAVRCKRGGTVRVDVSAPSGTRVKVAGGGGHGGSFHRDVRVDPGRQFTVAVRSHGSHRTHHVRCVPHDFPRWKVARHGHPQASYYLITPSHFDTGERAYMAVVDSRGVPLWWMGDTPPPFDAHLLPDGDLAWTHLAVKEPVYGPAEEHALDGRLVRTFTTQGTGANGHDLQVQPDGSAFMIAYPPRDHVDLSPWGGPKDATVLYGEIQQLSPAGQLLWRWSTAPHVAIGETKHWLHFLLFGTNPVALPDGRSAYDLFHMNSISPFGDRVVLSDRFDDAVYEIDRTSGKVLWKLGGTKTRRSLRILGDPLAKQDFGGQHDARALDGGRIVTVYDNGALRDRPPRALEFRIDAKKRTARLLRAVTYRPADDSVCCGSARLLPRGDWVISWGHTPWVTETTHSGRPVLTIKFEHGLQSYRAEPVLPHQLARSALRRGMDAMAP